MLCITVIPVTGNILDALYLSCYRYSLAFVLGFFNSEKVSKLCITVIPVTGNILDALYLSCYRHSLAFFFSFFFLRKFSSCVIFNISSDSRYK